MGHAIKITGKDAAAAAAKNKNKDLANFNSE